MLLRKKQSFTLKQIQASSKSLTNTEKLKKVIAMKLWLQSLNNQRILRTQKKQIPIILRKTGRLPEEMINQLKNLKQKKIGISKRSLKFHHLIKGIVHNRRLKTKAKIFLQWLHI